MNGIVLAGGKSSRFGRNKAFLKIENLSLIERTLHLLSQIFPTIYVAANSPSDYQHLAVPIAVDVFKDCGPLGGIHAGLIASSSHENFIVACDMPFLSPDLIRYFSENSEGYDVLLPRFFGKLHPLFAVYSKNCLPQIEKQLKSRDLKLTNLIPAVNSKIVEEEQVRAFDPPGQTFTNLNTQEEYAEISR